ncbi:MAG: hypothetical protein NC124_12490 [Clostridium sp.]|nr:hypothetical protein [Clostridium sp.]
MVTLTFEFNKDKIAKAGYTEDELLQPMREHAHKYGISEVKNGVFSKDGEYALCAIGMFVTGITRSNFKYISYFDHWTLDVDGEEEDCIVETKKWYQKKGIPIVAEG